MSNQHKNDHKAATTAATTAAMKKVSAKKENDICRYIPGPKGGYIHHFSLKKMRHEDPEQFLKVVTAHIIEPSNPTKLPPKPRAPRGSRKRRDPLPLSKQDLDLLLLLAHQSGRSDIIRKLAPNDLKAIKRELLASIKKNEVKEDLWQSYVESIATTQAFNPSNQSKPAFATTYSN